MKGISQRYIYDTNRKSWDVRITSHQSKSFLFKKYNGKEEALEVARKWRDEECRRLGIVIDSHAKSFGECRRSAKGYRLVTCSKTNRARWRASYYHDGKTKIKDFSVNKYGFNRARKLAKQQRVLWKTGELVPFEEIT